MIEGVRSSGQDIPCVASEARKSSWPDANAGWMFGKPPSVPALLVLYLERENGTVSSEDPGGWIGCNNGLRLNFYLLRVEKGFILYYVLQRPDVGIFKLTEVSLDVVVEINLTRWSVKSHSINVYSFQCTLTTVNSDSLGYPLVVP